MRLMWVHLRGFRRFESAQMQVDGRLVAIVGPNEAGKSSFLDALLRTNDTDPIPTTDLTRDLGLPLDPVLIKLRFALDQGDLDATALVTGAKSLRWLTVEKHADGTIDASVEPQIPLDLGPRSKCASAVERAVRLKWGKALSREEHQLGARLDRVGNLISQAEVLSPVDRDELRGLADALDEEAVLPRAVASLAEQLRTLALKEPTELPSDVAADLLLDRRPTFLRFSVEHRDLQSAYELAGLDLRSTPPALANICRLAGLDLPKVQSRLVAGDYAAAEKPIEDANKNLAAFFETSWTQSGITVHLSNQETRLHILASTQDGPYTDIRERSDGLRAFVALATFASLYSEGGPIVLLVDEAETHLHYDAQADLIRVFALQQAADKIIYTTHSAGCLPEDLGSGVRVIARSSETRSVVRNAFWTEGHGFSPLLLGMGASALAFGALRRAVVAEGASDLIVLPSLLREAVGVDSLGYQVAPGIAEVSSEAVEDLSLEAARIAYLVDGDPGGRAHATKLRKAGIPADRIITLGTTREGLAVEDLVRTDALVAAVNAELELSGRTQRIGRSAIPKRARAKAIETWCNRRAIPAPTKVALANRLVLDVRPTQLLVEPARKSTLLRLHGDISRLLGLPA